MAAGGEDGSWVELRGAGCPGPWRFSSCPADVELMLLEAQLDAEPYSPLPVMSPPGWDDAGPAPLGQQPRPHEPRQPRLRHRRPPAQQELPPLPWELHGGRLPPSPTCAHRHLPSMAMPCSLQPPLCSLPGGAVAAKKGPFSSELLLVLVPSLLLSHLLTLGLGIYIGKQLAASSANPL